MEDSCLFCNRYEEGHPNTVDYLCSNCVQNFSIISEDQIKKLKEKASEKKNPRITKAIELYFG